ncbi:MAG: Asp-tRNA(Asn)/Glu-tRNA(Gln) amidotransferase subunit GatC [Nitrospiraceae bacterium]
MGCWPGWRCCYYNVPPGLQPEPDLVYVQKLNTFDTKGVEPTATVLGQVNVFREDSVAPSLSAAEAVANAPETEGQAFLVPKIIEDRER